MLASHPSIATGPETHFFAVMSRSERLIYDDTPRRGGIREYLSPDEVYGSISELFHTVISKVPHPRGPSRYFLEKSPQHCLFAPLIIRCLPESRFIHMVRDGRHSVASMIHAGRTWAKAKFPDNATIAAELWKKSVLSARRIPELLKNRQHYYEIRYEELRRSPAEQLKTIFQWLELPVEDIDIDEIVRSNELQRIKQKKRFESIPVPTELGRYYDEPEGFFAQGAIATESPNLSLLETYQCYQIFGELLQNLEYCTKLPRIPWWVRVASSWRLRKLLGLSPV
jgi:hypothetical protein